MMRVFKRILLFCLLFTCLNLFFAADECNNPPPPGAPGNDNADENYSYASYELTDTIALGTGQDIRVLRSGYYREATALLERFARRVNDFSGHEALMKASYTGTIVFLPTGSLAGKEGDAVLKQNLKSLVERGATIICLAQNY